MGRVLQFEGDEEDSPPPTLDELIAAHAQAVTMHDSTYRRMVAMENSGEPHVYDDARSCWLGTRDEKEAIETQILDMINSSDSDSDELEDL